jgi:LysM repeat protein
MMARKSWFLLLILLAVACSAKTISPTPTPTVLQPTATPTVAPPTATPTPAFYVIQPGDTLSVIAERFGVPLEELQKANNIDDPNVIRVNQKLIIPGPTPVVTATLPPTVTPTPNIPPQLEIVDVIGRGAPGTETVIIVNRGRAVLLTQWTLRDAQSNAFVFPNIYLGEGAELRVHTGSGENTPQHLFWNRDTAVWEEAGDTVVLADDRGVVYASKPLE